MTRKTKQTALVKSAEPFIVQQPAVNKTEASPNEIHSLAKESRALIAPDGPFHYIVKALNDIRFYCLNDRVLVLQAQPREKIGHIVIPDVAKEKMNVGIVIAVGKGYRDGATLVPLQVEPGQIVNFAKYAGTDVEIAGFKFLQLREDEIHGACG